MRILCLLSCVLSCVNGWAQGIRIETPSHFSGPTTVLDFEQSGNRSELPRYNFPGIGNQWFNSGVLISDSTPENGAARYASTGEEIPTYSGSNGLSYGGLQPEPGGFVEYSFFSTESMRAISTEAGIWVINGSAFGGQPSTITFFDRTGQVIQSITSSGTYFFAGLRYEEGIASVRISDPDYFLTDNLRFGPLTPIPEPSTGALILLGMVVCTTLRRRVEK